MKQSFHSTLFTRSGWLLLSAWLSLQSCAKEKPVPSPPFDYRTGVYVVNEGPFGQGTGSITYRSRDARTIVPDVFGSVNGRPLGNIAQRMGFRGNTGLIVVNNAGKIEWVDLGDFRSIGTTSGLELPSALLIDSAREQAYVTEWVSFTEPGRLAVIDLNTRQIVRRYDVGHFPNALALQGDRLLVANGNEQTVTEIDLNNRIVADTLTVGDRPQSFVRRGTELWLQCGGTPSWAGIETAGSLWRMSPGPVRGYPLAAATDHPADLALHPDGQRFICRLGGTLSLLNPNDAQNRVDATPVVTRELYHVSVDPFDPRGRIYGTDAGDFQSNGRVYVFDRGFALVDSFGAGVAPGFIAYR